MRRFELVRVITVLGVTLAVIAAACEEEDPLSLNPWSVTATVSDGVVGRPTSIELMTAALDPSAPDQATDIAISIAGANAGLIATVDQNPDGSYTGRYTPVTIGLDFVHVSVRGVPILSSPLTSRVRLSGFGAATVDGEMQPGEWAGASGIQVFTGDLAGTTLHAMNDDANLYLALRVPDPSLDAGDLMRIRFDNIGNGVQEEGDDELTVSVAGLSDLHYSGTSWGESDGIQDGVGAASHDGSAVVMEVAHPLDSGDVNDFGLSEGDHLGFCLTYFDDGHATDGTTFPSGCNLAANYQGDYGQILIAGPPPD